MDLCLYVLTWYLVTTAVERALSQLPHLMPDFMLVFAVPVLAHDPHYTEYNNRLNLQRVQKCLWFILEPLMLRNDNYCFGFYKSLIERMKNHMDAVNPTDENINRVRSQPVSCQEIIFHLNKLRFFYKICSQYSGINFNLLSSWWNGTLSSNFSYTLGVFFSSDWMLIACCDIRFMIWYGLKINYTRKIETLYAISSRIFFLYVNVL